MGPFVRQAPRVAPFERERQTLEDWRDDPVAPRRLRLRARIILRAAEGHTNHAIARELGVTPATVSLWRHRFVVHRLEGIQRGAPYTVRVPAKKRSMEARILHATLRVPRPDGRRWSTRSLARFLSVTHMQVYRVWKAHGIPVDHSIPAIRPLPRALWVDVVGYFRCPPLRAIVFANDETVGPSASDPNSPSESGEREPSRSPLLFVPAPGASELEWSLQGLRELFPERAIPLSQPKDLLIFLRGLERTASPTLRFHVIVDHSDEPTLRRLRTWVARRPRFELEIVEGESAWGKSIDRYLRGWDAKRLSGSSFRGVAKLTETLLQFAGRFSDPGPAFAWRWLNEMRPGTAEGLAARRGVAPGEVWQSGNTSLR
jgi:transposase